jgi:subtilase family serine protease
MKKYLLIVVIATFTLSFAACSGKKGDTAPANESAKEEVTAPTPAVTNENDVLAKYEVIINKAIELQEKVSKGDATAVQEYTKLSEEMTSIAVELQNAIANMTPEEVQKFTELGQKWLEAATKNAQP